MRNLVKITLAEQIYTILREDIINQNIKCGEKLTLKILQEKFNTSSTPIREALNRLSQEGLIEHVTNIGAKVIDIKEKDIEEIYDFCLYLDLAALNLALKSKKIDDIICELNNCIELQEKSLELGNLEDFRLHSDNFHDIFFKYADNSRLYNASKNIRSQFSILTTIYQNFTVAQSLVLLEHKNITSSIVNRDFDKTISLMKSHFEHAKSYLLDNIRNIEHKDMPL
ncbi:GntR family transcriptional regulator [Clostridium sp. MSJ-11]|uniref:GntR family transcriptional regulator n=1 Tax=Clostridium mobile TaxID=2841512 RepID=A0ABS6ELK0_9CLOT|nr:GntR family transcriptional regulator [Clostridium mobile]MBU5485997.1 GntR family transcriptional regulator [Clostridium mobile]